MIIWLASYPKSGNTWMWFFIKSYFNPPNKKFSINHDKDDPYLLETFPTERGFNELNINYQDFFDISKNWITDLNNTLGAIHIVRDPRDVLVSYSSYKSENIDKTLEILLSNDSYEYSKFNDKFYKRSLMGSWSSHYNSWKNYKSKETLLVKYEDMVNKSNSTF